MLTDGLGADQNALNVDALLDESAAIIAIANAEGQLTYVSPGAVTVLLGDQRYEDLGEVGAAVVHPDDIHGTAEAYQRALRMPNIRVPVAFRVRHATRGWSHVEGWWVNRLADPRIGGVVMHLVDVTERAEAAAALAASSEHVTRVFNSMALGVIVQTADGEFTQWNPAAERILGIGGRHIGARTTEDPRWNAIRPDGTPFPQHDEPGFVALRTGKTQSDVVIGVHRPDGELRWLSVTSVPLFLNSDKPAFAVSSFEDITERRSAQARLERVVAGERVLQEVRRDIADGSADDLDHAITRALARFGDMLGIDYLSLFVQSEDGATVAKPYWWSRDEYPVQDDLDTATAQWEQLAGMSEMVMEIPHPEEAGVTLTLLHLPLGIDETHVGEIVAITREERGWDADDIALVEQFSVLLGSTLSSRRAQDALRNREQFLQMLMATSTDVVLAIDADAFVTYVSPTCLEVVGLAPEELVGQPIADLIHPEDFPNAIEAFAKLVSDIEPDDAVEVRAQHADGHWVWLECTGRAGIGLDGVQTIVVNARDVTERKAQAAALAQVQQRLGEAWAHGPAGMAIVSLDGYYLDVNPAHCTLLGFAHEDLVGAPLSRVVDRDHLAELMRQLHEVVRGERERAHAEVSMLRADGGTAWGRISASVVRNERDQPVHMIVLVEDVTERWMLQQRLEYEATHDALTHLPQRNLVLELLNHAIGGSQRHGDTVGVLFIDLDQFKKVNDTLGHAAGDRLLQDFASRLETAIRGGDVAGRLGGDEFVVVCPELADPSGIAHIAERVLEIVQRPFAIEGIEVFVGASIGIAVTSGDVDAAELLRQADTAAYRAKERGRNRYEMFDEELRRTVATRMDTETALRHAVERGEFLLHYQPIVDARTNLISGMEALVRWDRGEHGLVKPGEFLEIAEETGLIVPLGARVLELACAQLAQWQYYAPDPKVTVNVSTRQLVHTDFLETVQRALRTTGVAATGLCFEITESSLMQDHDTTVPLLEQVRSFGVQIAIDDFGTGYSSLSYLRRLPVDIVKIDRSFVAELGHGRDDATIVAGIVKLADALGKTVIAEGVENEQHTKTLLKLGCSLMQGFHFSPPLAANEATNAVIEGSLGGAKPTRRGRRGRR